MKITSEKIIFSSDDWLDGLNPQYGQNGFVGNSLTSMDSFNPFKVLGVASPGLLASDVTNVATVTGRIVAGIPKYVVGGYTKGVLVGDDGKLQELTFSTNTITNSGGVFPHTIAGTTPVGEDIVAYSIGSAKFAFYSHRNTVNWNIGTYNYDATFDDDYMSTVATSPLNIPYLTDGKSAPHPMIVGADDLLYVGDRNFVHGFDGQATAVGTFYPAVLTLPEGYIITSFAKNQEYLAVFAYKENLSDINGEVYGEATCFFWDYVSLDPFKIVDLDDNYVSSAFSWKGSIACFTTGRPSNTYQQSSINKKSDFRVYDGSVFESVASFDTSPPIYRGVDVISNEVYWNSSGTVFYYGSRLKGQENKLYKVGQSSSGSESGFLKSLTSTQQYISSGDGASGGLKVFQTDTYYGGNFTTIYAEPILAEGKVARLKWVEIILASKGNALANPLVINMNYLSDSGTGQQTIVSSTPLFTKYRNKYSVDSSGSPLVSFSMISLQASWDTGTSFTNTPPQIKTVILTYELKDYT